MRSMQSSAEAFLYLGLIFSHIIFVSTAPYEYNNITVEQHGFDENIYDWKQKYAEAELELERDDVMSVDLPGITVVVDDEEDWGFTDSDTFILRSVAVNLIDDAPMDKCALALGKDDFKYRVVRNADGSCTIAVPIQDVKSFYEPRANRVRRVVSGRRRKIGRRTRRIRPSHSSSLLNQAFGQDEHCGFDGKDFRYCGAGDEVLCDEKKCEVYCDVPLSSRGRRDATPDEEPIEEVHNRVKRSGCDCQCSSFTSSSGAGNCRTTHQGRRFCYVHDTHDDCDDIRQSSQFSGQRWSWDACETPGRSSSQCKCDDCCGVGSDEDGCCVY